jgi:ribosomal protein S18 acetylase RimI-like enzyme
MAQVKDAPVIAEMLQALSDHSGGGTVASVASLVQHGFGDRPLFWSILAEDPTGPKGMIVFYPDFSTHRGQAGVYVQDLYICPNMRGMGIGRALLQEAMTHAFAAWQATYLTLAVEPENTAACRFYNQLGFEPRGYDFYILQGEGLAALTP